MPEPDPARIRSFASPKDLGRWLSLNHDTENELWIKIFKKGTGTLMVAKYAVGHGPLRNKCAYEIRTATPV